MRVGHDGLLLAVSDAALTLLGATQLSQVLGTDIANYLNGAPGLWRDFAERVGRSGSASVECEMIDLGGAPRAVVLMSVAMPDHPDGLDSILVTVRDVSTARRLEASLHERDALRRSMDDAAARLAAVDADRAQLHAALEQANANLQEVGAGLDEVTRERQQLITALEQAMAQRYQMVRSAVSSGFAFCRRIPKRRS